MKIKKIKPLLDRIVVTADTYVEADALTASGILDVSKAKKGFKEYQKVIQSGTNCRWVKDGDIICINPMRYARMKHKKDSMKEGMDEHYNSVVSYEFPMVKLLDEKGVEQEYLFLYEGDVEFIVEEFID